MCSAHGVCGALGGGEGGCPMGHSWYRMVSRSRRSHMPWAPETMGQETHQGQSQGITGSPGALGLDWTCGVVCPSFSPTTLPPLHVHTTVPFTTEGATAWNHGFLDCSLNFKKCSGQSTPTSHPLAASPTPGCETPRGLSAWSCPSSFTSGGRDVRETGPGVCPQHVQG